MKELCIGISLCLKSLQNLKIEHWIVWTLELKAEFLRCDSTVSLFLDVCQVTLIQIIHVINSLNGPLTVCHIERGNS